MKHTIKSLLGFITVLIIFINPELKAQMYWNQAASFAGNSTSYVSVPNSPSLNITGSITLEALINPANNTGSKGIISKGGALGTTLRYGLRFFNSSITFITSGATRISSKVSTIIPINDWTHVAVTLDSATGQIKLYINGNLDTSAVVPGSSPPSNTDSLYIGISGNSTPFIGKIDYVRVWNNDINAITIAAAGKSQLGISRGGDFNNLVLSIPFQTHTAKSPYLSFRDHSKFINNGKPRNVTAFDLSDRPSKFSQYNDCAFFQSGGAFLAGDDESLSPTNKMTIELWVYPKGNTQGLIYKGNFLGTVTDYGLYIETGKLKATINNNSISSNDSIKNERWTHIAFTYFGSTGAYEFYVNGKRGTTGNISPANINNGTDSLIIGSYPTKGNFLGFMDELRITTTIKSAAEINRYMFTTINETNSTSDFTNAVFSFDGTDLPSTDISKRLGQSASASFTFNGGFTFGFVQSPILNFTTNDFNNGSYLNMPNKRLPATGGSGIVRDTIEIFRSEIINDINIFVALNHNAEENLKISITSPLGATTDLYTNTQLLGFNSNVITIFDPEADSSLNNSAYLSFSPKIKPVSDITSIYSGNNSKGKWVLTVNDEAGSDTGFFSAWGIQINNNTNLPFTLDCTSMIEGFYNAVSNLMIPDSVRYFLRSSVSPYSIIDSAKTLTDNAGRSYSSFFKAQPGTGFFLALKHRNSIETWSSTVITFDHFTKQSSYNFSNLQTAAFGNNITQVDASPVRFAFFSGDVNQDGTIDLADGSLIDNDAFNFESGYMPTDVNGDGFVDVADGVFADNNGFNFVGKITP
ncbi:MAG: LamG-like jellyroll fold domain-containing protein [Ignavibacteria bacterium]